MCVKEKTLVCMKEKIKSIYKIFLFVFDVNYLGFHFNWPEIFGTILSSS